MSTTRTRPRPAATATRRARTTSRDERIAARAAHPSPSEREAAGQAARAAVPPEWHAAFTAAPDRRDPVEVMIEQSVSRVPELVPVRHGRMLVSPFAFFRGAAAVMAGDLAQTPDSGLEVQVCGDAHLVNFGLFASPERRLMFDLNDFDETHPGPWEWDVKRLAASLEIAGRQNGLSAKQRRGVQLATVRRYQQAMTGFAGMRELDVWYARADVEELREMMAGQLKKSQLAALDKTITKAHGRDSRRALGRLCGEVDGHHRILADPPLIVPVSDLLPDQPRAFLDGELRTLIARYGSTLTADRRAMLGSFDFVDLARKVVGVGSVGTRCWIALMFGRDGDDPLFLQIKEAQTSVVADYGGVRTGHYNHQGERVVRGQRLMQATGDPFLGWETADGIDGQRRHFYVRQLADWKGSVDVPKMVPAGLSMYGELCGWTLARAHARTGDRIAIAAYLGGDDPAFAEAIAAFSAAYADQNDKDHAALEAAVRDGRLEAVSGV
ncbi:MAG TPA: DUF2252 domain-containing protein [Actinocrinis sp.]|nr:DUF2252 domain-containing protein [Actinocrinis sp.]